MFFPNFYFIPTKPRLFTFRRQLQLKQEEQKRVMAEVHVLTHCR